MYILLAAELIDTCMKSMNESRNKCNAENEAD